jgi:hypothetical protein
VRRVFKEYATGTYTKQEILQKATQWGLTNRRGQPLSSQAIGMLLRNRLYVGIIDVPEFGVRDQRGDCEPLISEEIFYKAQAVLSGKVSVVAPWQKRRPDFPLPAVRAVGVGTTHLRCLLANSWPEPDLRYFSNARARRSSENSTRTSMIQGLPDAVCGHRPALWASSLDAMLEVRPV